VLEDHELAHPRAHPIMDILRESCNLSSDLKCNSRSCPAWELFPALVSLVALQHPAVGSFSLLCQPSKQTPQLAP
jgi:hypothetical protein